MVLEPIFEAGFRPCSHGFRPGRRAQDAIAEIRHLTSVRYEWVLEGDITACFDEIDHTALMGRVRRRITWARAVNWLRRKHPRANWKRLRRRYLPGWWPTEGDTTMFDPNAVAITYARYRGQITDTTPWAAGTTK